MKRNRAAPERIHGNHIIDLLTCLQEFPAVHLKNLAFGGPQTKILLRNFDHRRIDLNGIHFPTFLTKALDD